MHWVSRAIALKLTADKISLYMPETRFSSLWVKVNPLLCFPYPGENYLIDAFLLVGAAGKGGG
jgi:hypothetical protein